MQYERKICKIYLERFIIEKQNLRILIFLTGVWGVIALSAHFLRGFIQMRAKYVQEEGVGQKRPKNCVHTLCMAPNSDLKLVTGRSMT